MSLLNILAGLLTAALLVHFRSAYLLAQRQQFVARRLRSYLMYWQSWILDNNVFKLFHIGVEWNSEIDALIRNGEGAAEMLALKEKKRNVIQEIKAAIENNKIDLEISNLEKILGRMPSNSIDYIQKTASQFEQNLLDGKSFISDDDACTLGPYAAQVCVNLKMNFISGSNKFLGQIVLFLAAPEKYSISEASKDISDLIWTGILISKDIDTLTKHIDRISKKSLWALTWTNMRG